MNTYMWVIMIVLALSALNQIWIIATQNLVRSTTVPAIDACINVALLVWGVSLYPWSTLP